MRAGDRGAATGARSQGGFTLVEVLVALAIVAVALLAGVRAMGVMARADTELRSRLLAQLSAENRVAYLRAVRAFPPTGVTSEACPQGTLSLVCRQEIRSTPNAAFRRVDIRVVREDEPERALAEIFAVLPGPGA